MVHRRAGGRRRGGRHRRGRRQIGIPSLARFASRRRHGGAFPLGLLASIAGPSIVKGLTSLFKRRRRGRRRR